MYDDILLIDKPDGMSSFGVVARIRRVLSQEAGRKVKVGHTGTLDPFATGLMILVTGKMCREAGSFSKLDKTYEATIRLGEVSSTGDPEGEITALSSQEPTLEQINDCVKQFIGVIEQRPPMFSAIKIDGKRAYQLARNGEVVEMPLRTVTIDSLEVVAYAYPELRIRTDVSSGTYIRTLAQDIGEALGAGAYCSQLRRTRVGEHTIDAAKTLADFGITS